MASTIVAKFGGSSMADADQIRKVMAIITAKAKEKRNYIVVSAPGRIPGVSQTKITDLLYQLYRSRHNEQVHQQLFEHIADRYRSTVSDLNLALDLSGDLAQLRVRSRWANHEDWTASRGEYLSARILAAFLQYEFVDATEIIKLNQKGELDMKRTLASVPAIRGRKCVIPGFYGVLPSGKVKTFSRGGSDYTGAIVARMLGASVYENWTDVPGVLMADPNVVPNPPTIATMTRMELNELTYRGAVVVHERAVEPLIGTTIPIWVRNTNQPKDQGTLIVPDDQAPKRKAGTIVGIAGKKGCMIFTTRKTSMNAQKGFLENLARAFSREGVSIEHAPGSIDTMSVVIAGGVPERTLKRVERNIRRLCKPDSIEVDRGISLICTVGSAMRYTPMVAARVLGAVGARGINVRIIDQGASEVSIVIGVNDADCDSAIAGIYEAFQAL